MADLHNFRATKKVGPEECGFGYKGAGDTRVFFTNVLEAQAMLEAYGTYRGATLAVLAWDDGKG